MDIRNMRQLLAIRTHGSFAKAAEALGLSQPSLSTSIGRLEDQLGVRLIDRASTGSALTPIGELIARRAGKVLADTESILRDVERVAGGEAGVLRLGIGTALKPNFLQDYVRGVAERHPALRLHIEVLDRDELLPLLKTLKLDLIICGVGEEIVDPDLVVTPIMTAPVVAVSHPGHPLVAERSIPKALFADYPSAGSKVLYYSNADLLDVSDVGADISHYTANDYEPVLALALSGACTLIAPAHVVQPHLDSGALVRLNLDWSFAAHFVAITTRMANYAPIINKAVAYAAELGSRLQDDDRRRDP